MQTFYNIIYHKNRKAYGNHFKEHCYRTSLPIKSHLRKKEIHRTSVKYILKGHVWSQYTPLTAVAAAYNCCMT